MVALWQLMVISSRFFDCLEASNSKGEYYLTDIIEISNQNGGYVSIVEGDETEALGMTHNKI